MDVPDDGYASSHGKSLQLRGIPHRVVQEKKPRGTSFDAKIGYLHLLGLTEQLKNGDKTLNDWAEVIRSVTKGQRIKDKKMIQKIDPELHHAVKNLTNRVAKKNKLK